MGAAAGRAETRERGRGVARERLIEWEKHKKRTGLQAMSKRPLEEQEREEDEDYDSEEDEDYEPPQKRLDRKYEEKDRQLEPLRQLPMMELIEGIVAQRIELRGFGSKGCRPSGGDRTHFSGPGGTWRICFHPNGLRLGESTGLYVEAPPASGSNKVFLNTLEACRRHIEALERKAPRPEKDAAPAGKPITKPPAFLKQLQGVLGKLEDLRDKDEERQAKAEEGDSDAAMERVEKYMMRVEVIERVIESIEEAINAAEEYE